MKPSDQFPLEQRDPDQIADRMAAADWWRQAVIYQIYPRSFADGDGDGIGDLTGVLAHVDHLVALDVDAVWFSPFYPSALTDGGYDVDDYRDIDPRIGTLEQFGEVVATLHCHGIKVVIDIVPNHSSDRHAWFQAALAAGPGSPERERYLFRDGRGEHGAEPPSDWRSMFGGSAWTRVEDGQWYLHLFNEHQPDWNWANPEVREDFLETLRFWGDRGVDGFRVDVAMALTKDLSEPLPGWDEVMAGVGAPFVPAGTEDPFAPGQNPIWDRDEVHEVYASWRQVFNSYDPPLFAVAEAWVPAVRRARYASADGLGQAFNFDLLQAAWSADAFTEVIRHNLDLAAASGSSSTWVLSNHDVVRHATRFATDGALQAFGGPTEVLDESDRRRGLARALAATAIILALPGSCYLYQGEELGLPEVRDIPIEQLQDRSGHDPVTTRDGCRVPLPWSSQEPWFGFSAGGSHLPQPAWFADFSVARQLDDPRSTLQTYRIALALRRGHRVDESLEWLDLGPQVLAFRRSDGWTSVTNFGPEAVSLPSGTVEFATGPLVGADLPPDTGVWLS